MGKWYFIFGIIMALGQSLSLQAQVISLNQDCAKAVSLCNGRYVFPFDFRGKGAVNDLDSVQTCLGRGEENSSWYKLKFASSGYLAFIITQISAPTDYDFALFDITGQGCAALLDTQTSPVRCSFAATLNEPTGLNTSATDTFAPATGPDFLQRLAVDSGDVLALLISNLDLASAGYILDFSGTTATMIVDEPLEVNDAFTAICTNYLHAELYFNQAIDSNSVLADFSQFSITDNTGAALAVADIVFDSVAHKLLLVIERPTYNIDSIEIDYVPGTGGSAIAGRCGTQLLASGSYSFSSLFNNMGTSGFSVSTIGRRYSFQALSTNIAFVDWYVDGALVTKRQATSPFVKNLDVGVEYEVCMIAEIGCNIETTCQTLVYSGITGIGETASAFEMELYPNPAQGTVTITLPHGTNQVRVLNMKGVLYTEATTGHMGSYVLNVSALQQGIYIVQVTNPQGVNAQRLVIAR